MFLPKSLIIGRFTLISKLTEYYRTGERNFAMSYVGFGSEFDFIKIPFQGSGSDFASKKGYRFPGVV